MVLRSHSVVEEEQFGRIIETGRISVSWLSAANWSHGGGRNEVFVDEKGCCSHAERSCLRCSLAARLTPRLAPRTRSRAPPRTRIARPATSAATTSLALGEAGRPLPQRRQINGCVPSTGDDDASLTAKPALASRPPVGDTLQSAFPHVRTRRGAGGDE